VLIDYPSTLRFGIKILAKISRADAKILTGGRRGVDCMRDDSGESTDGLYFEDLAEGDQFTFGPRTVSRESILRFAERYDPQPFHVDEGAAEESLFGGLVASGWHTAAVMNRMMIDDVFADIAVMGGSGVDDLRWPSPVRAGETLSGSVIVANRETGRHDDRGYVDLNVVVDGDDGPVLTMTSTLLVRRAAASA
jgi:acyl dehydratase